MEIYRHEDHCNEEHCVNCNKCLKNGWIPALGNTYCRKCHTDLKKNIMKNPIYINKEIQYWIDVLTDLFCLDHKPIVQLRKGNHTHGYCHWVSTPIIINVYLDKNNKLSLKTLVHEFLHASGWDHTWEINGWANFRSAKDEFSPLIVKDLTGKRELLL